MPVLTLNLHSTDGATVTRVSLFLRSHPSCSTNCHNLWLACVCVCVRLARERMFLASRGDRPAIPNYIVVITDGRANNARQTWTEAIAARARGITILAVCLNSVFVYSATHPFPLIIRHCQWLSHTRTQPFGIVSDLYRCRKSSGSNWYSMRSYQYIFLTTNFSAFEVSQPYVNLKLHY